MEMNRDVVRNFFKDIFHQVAPEIAFDKISHGLPLRNQIEIDSLDFYNVIVSLQKKTGVYIPDSALTDLTTLDQLINYVLVHKKAGELNEFKS